MVDGIVVVDTPSQEVKDATILKYMYKEKYEFEAHGVLLIWLYTDLPDPE